MWYFWWQKENENKEVLENNDMEEWEMMSNDKLDDKEEVKVGEEVEEEEKEEEKEEMEEEEKEEEEEEEEEKEEDESKLNKDDEQLNFDEDKNVAELSQSFLTEDIIIAEEIKNKQINKRKEELELLEPILKRALVNVVLDMLKEQSDGGGCIAFKTINNNMIINENGFSTPYNHYKKTSSTTPTPSPSTFGNFLSSLFKKKKDENLDIVTCVDVRLKNNMNNGNSIEDVEFPIQFEMRKYLTNAKRTFISNNHFY